MLEIRLNCENCDKALPNESSEALICSYECTFCQDCVEHVLMNVCPNCGGGFHQRPVRPKELLNKYPPTQNVIYQPKNLQEFQQKLDRYGHVIPEKR